MATENDVAPVDIRPDVSVLGVFRHLNYKPWFALAEFVDNALQSFLENQEALGALQEPSTQVRVRVHIDVEADGAISVSDNAAGIYRDDWSRALRPAEPPPDTTGLAEFGMGMKTASAWFGQELTIRSTALGEPVARSVTLDFGRIVEERVSTVQPESFEAAANEHGTVITVRGLFKPPRGRTISKIREHLASIYRMFLRDGTLELVYRSGGQAEEPLYPEEPPVLTASRWDDPDGDPVLWHKSIEMDLGEGLSASGFAALRERASTSRAGFALFRRRRLIEGSGDETYRPSAIFGAPNSYIYQRLFGELTLTGFDISHTKDGFRWEENEEPFVELLREELDADPLPLLRQARNFRVGIERSKSIADAASSAAEETADLIGRELNQSSVGEDEAQDDSVPQDLPPGEELFSAEVAFDYAGHRWRVIAECSNDVTAMDEWFEIAEKRNGEEYFIRLRLSLRHPFTERFSGIEYENFELLMRFAAALSIAEITARWSGVSQAHETNRRVNDLLRTVFSKT